MERFERILVCIEEPDRDASMLARVGRICQAARAKEVHVLHVFERVPAPGPGGEGEITPPKITPESLRKLIDQHLAGHGGEQIIGSVVEGEPLVEILRYGNEKEIDLIVVGRWTDGQEHHKTDAVLARRVTRKATCSVLVLPPKPRERVARIVVPVRDSECSANALEVAIEVAAHYQAELVCLNVFAVHGGYRSVGTTLEEHERLLRESAEKECVNLLSRVDKKGVSFMTQCVPDLHGHPVAVIRDRADALNADLIVIGARGRSGAAGVLLGAVTEDLIRTSEVPLLAVKRKGECLSLLRALLSLVEGPG